MKTSDFNIDELYPDDDFKYRLYDELHKSFENQLIEFKGYVDEIIDELEKKNMIMALIAKLKLNMWKEY